MTAPFSLAHQTIAAGMAFGLIDFAAARGADRAALLAMVGLADSTAPDRNRRVPLVRYAAMLHEAARQCGDPALAIHYSEATDFAELSIVGLIGFASETMSDALLQLNRYGRLITDIQVDGPERFALVSEPDGLWLIDRRIDIPPFPELTESTFVRMVAATRRFGTIPYATLAEVTHADRGQGAELARALGAPVRFGAPRNAIRVSAEWQSYRIALYPRYAFGLFCEQADRMVDELQAARTAAGEVERAILPILHTGRASAEAVAAQLGLSTQSLYRALRGEGTSFEEVLTGLRHRFAKGYLGKGKASHKEIAFLLGFSDVSSFSRAFKRWEGRPPGAYKNAALGVSVTVATSPEPD